MSNWVKCTESKTEETVFVNLDNAMSVSRGKKGDTIIAFPGGKDDYVRVKASPGDLFEAMDEDEPATTPLKLLLRRIPQSEDIGRQIGKLALGERDLRHGVLGQHDLPHDGARGLSFPIGDLVKARHIRIGVFLLGGADEMTIGAKLLGQPLA